MFRMHLSDSCLGFMFPAEGFMRVADFYSTLSGNWQAGILSAGQDWGLLSPRRARRTVVPCGSPAAGRQSQPAGNVTVPRLARPETPTRAGETPRLRAPSCGCFEVL